MSCICVICTYSTVTDIGCINSVRYYNRAHLDVSKSKVRFKCSFVVICDSLQYATKTTGQ